MSEAGSWAGFVPLLPQPVDLDAPVASRFNDDRLIVGVLFFSCDDA
jgi:hypothetical protein